MAREKNEFDKLIELINQRSPLQKKRLQQYLGEQDKQFWHLANRFILSFKKFLHSEALDVEYLVTAYLKLCQNMLKEQTRFLRSGKYSVASSEEAYKNIYLNKDEMMSYMCGLALSQFLWRNHYAIYRFFGKQILHYAPKISSYLEIGSGHGLFLVEALRNTQCKRYEVVDISPISIEISKKVAHFMTEKADKIQFREMNILDYDITDAKFDFITIGEVLEHVEDPFTLLKKIKSLLLANGRVFMTTCSNCPAIDHVYLFNSVDEIKDMVHNCGLIIEGELVLPVENLSPCEMQYYKVGHNYAGVLKQ